MEERPAALGTLGGHLALGVLEVALNVAAPEAEGYPVAECPPALLLNPAALARHALTVPRGIRDASLTVPDTKRRLRGRVRAGHSSSD